MGNGRTRFAHTSEFADRAAGHAARQSGLRQDLGFFGNWADYLVNSEAEVDRKNSLVSIAFCQPIIALFLAPLLLPADRLPTSSGPRTDR